jgi:Bax protein
MNKAQKFTNCYFLIVLFLFLWGCVFTQKKEPPSQVTLISVHSTKELIQLLDRYDLWHLEENKNRSVSVVIKNLPPDFRKIKDRTLRRRIFIHTILPSILIALAEVENERSQLIEILNKINLPQKINLDNLLEDKRLSSAEIKFLTKLTQKYRTTNTTELLKRINIVPLSLILAQAAIESNWGTSRFALEGNNLYGIWTYKRDGMKPLNRDPNAYHKVARYSSILEATQDYLYNLNVGWAYHEFREARLNTTDALILAQYLVNYSQLGSLYSIKLKEVIAKYHLKQYDIYAKQIKAYSKHFNLCALTQLANFN